MLKLEYFLKLVDHAGCPVLILVIPQLNPRVVQLCLLIFFVHFEHIPHNIVLRLFLSLRFTALTALSTFFYHSFHPLADLLSRGLISIPTFILIERLSALLSENLNFVRLVLK